MVVSYLICSCGEKIPIRVEAEGTFRVTCLRCGQAHKGRFERSRRIISEETLPKE